MDQAEFVKRVERIKAVVSKIQWVDFDRKTGFLMARVGDKVYAGAKVVNGADTVLLPDDVKYCQTNGIPYLEIYNQAYAASPSSVSKN